MEEEGGVDGAEDSTGEGEEGQAPTAAAEGDWACTMQAPTSIKDGSSTGGGEGLVVCIAGEAEGQASPLRATATKTCTSNEGASRMQERIEVEEVADMGAWEEEEEELGA